MTDGYLWDHHLGTAKHIIKIHKEEENCLRAARFSSFLYLAVSFDLGNSLGQEKLGV